MRFHFVKVGGRTGLIFLAIFLVFKSLAHSLPKNRSPATGNSPAPQQPIAAQKASPSPASPVAVDDDEQIAKRNMLVYPNYRGGVSRTIQAGAPFLDVRIGIPETPGGNNHMRDQLQVSSSGVAHMVYGIFSGVPSAIDSAMNFFYFYNAYDCGNSNDLLIDPFNPSRLGAQMTAAGPPADPRPRVMNQGGLMIPNLSTGVPVVYGNRYILRTETPQADDISRRGHATMNDGAECMGLFLMDSTMGQDPNKLHPVAFALNESTWVATYRVIASSSSISFNYTTDRGLTWSAFQTLPTYSPWFNSVEITGSGTTFYIVSHADPNDPSAFQSTERPCYVKGTYNPSTGAITFGTITDITGDFELPGYLSNMIDIGATMVGDTLHVLWTDWNNYYGGGFPGPGGHVHHATVWPDGTVQGPHKVANINIDGRLPDRSTTIFNFAAGVWPMVELVKNPATNTLYALWSQPPDDGNFGWLDYEATGTLACYDIFCSASSNNGRAWDDPVNITMTNNPGCDGSLVNPCAHEDHFSAADFIVNDTIWIVSLVQNYPGIQESAVRSGFSPDPGPFTEHRDIFRLYKAPARAPVLSLRGDLGPLPTDTIKLFQINLQPRGAVFNTNLHLSNIGLVGFFLDSVTLEPGLNDGFLVTTQYAVSGTFVPVGGSYNFQVSFDPGGVGPNETGVRSGLLRAYVHSVSPFDNEILSLSITVYVVPTLCFNRKIRIHSASNYTDIGSQGTIKDGSGFGLHYDFDNSDRFHDGGVWIANSALQALEGVPGLPRKVSRQLFSDKFLRCIADIVLDSVSGGGYYNLYAKSVATDIEDSTLIWETIWEQSTHPDSSDFLLQTVQVANIGTTPIDSVALGVVYDIDVTSNISSASQNVSGDTSVNYGGRTFWLGWVAGNDVSIDTCSPNNEFYGVVVIRGSFGSPGDSIHPQGAVMYHQNGFAYQIGNGNAAGGDSLAQRYSWQLNECTSTRRRNHDTLTGAWQDTVGFPLSVCNGDANNGAPYRNDEGYVTIAKKVYNFPVNPYLQGAVGRYGLTGLASSIDDSTIPGPKETYTVIHIASNGGLTDLMANAVKGIDWYANHANIQVGGDILGLARLELAPVSASNVVGDSHTVTATLYKSGVPIDFGFVDFEVISGPHRGSVGTGVTGSSGPGKTSFTYRGSATGTDQIKANVRFVLFQPNFPPVSSNTATKTWLPPPLDYLQFDIPPTPGCGSSFPVNVGNELPIRIQASNPSRPVTLNVSGLPVGARLNPALPTTGNPAVTNFTWAPTSNDVGSHTVTFTASDGINSPIQCAFTINVLPKLDCPTTDLALLGILVSDFDGNTVLKFNNLCNLTQQFSAPGVLRTAEQAVLAPNGNLLVANFADNRIVEFSPTGALVRSVAPSQLNGPWGMAMRYPDSAIFVSSHYTDRILKLDYTSGNVIQTISHPNLIRPTGLAFGGPSNDLYVAGGNETYGEIFAFNGASGSFTGLRFTGGGLKGPKIGVTFRLGGNLFAGSDGTAQVLEFNPVSGQFVSSFTGGGMSRPQGLGVAPNSNFWVASLGSKSVLQFSPVGTFLSSCMGSGMSTPTHITFSLTPKGDLNGDRVVSPADIVLELNCVFLADPPVLGDCTCDFNCDGNSSPADVVLELNGVFLATSFPICP
jgi:hypothetical protein